MRSIPQIKGSDNYKMPRNPTAVWVGNLVTLESQKKYVGYTSCIPHPYHSSCRLPIHTMQVCVTLDHLSVPQPVSKLNLKATYPSTMELLRFSGLGPVPHMLLNPQCHSSNHRGIKYHFPHRL